MTISGINLDEDFDLKIDSSGDIDTVSGSNEIEKDLAYITSEALQDFIGEGKDSSVAYDVSRAIKDVIGTYDNVDEILRLSVAFGSWEDDYDMAVILGVTTFDGDNIETVVTE